MSHLTYAEAIITGILQGVTELFPISSLGHNVLVPALLGGQFKQDLNVAAAHSPYLAFVVALHVATAFAMIAFFWRDWIRIIRGFLSSVRNRQIVEPDQRLAWMIIIGTIPVGLVGVALQKVVTSVFAQPIFTALFLVANGGILLYSERQRTLAVSGPAAGFDEGFDGPRGRGERGEPGGRGLPGLGRRRRDDDDDAADGGFWDDSSWDEERRPTRKSPVQPPADPRFRDDPRRGGGRPPAPGFQPAPGQPQPGPGFQPGPGQPGPGPARGGYGPADDERTQVWNQQPGQQQWQGPDPRYNDPRRGQDPRYSQDPRRGGPGRRPPQEQPAPGQPAPGQGPAFTPSFNPAGGPPGGPGGPGNPAPPPGQPQPGQPAPGFSPHGGQDPRAPQEDVRTARYPQEAPPVPPVPPAGGGGPSFTPSGPDQGARGGGRPPWEGGPHGPRSGRGGYAPDPSEQTSIDVVDLPQQYDESDENVAADRRLATMSFKQALFVGAWQVLALLPGISRDGIVTVGGMRTHLSRADAVRFSFLLSAPVLLAAGMLKLPELAGPEGNGIMGPVIVGSILSFIGAYLATKFLTKYFEGEEKSLKPFGYYCLAFGILCLVLIPLGV